MAKSRREIAFIDPGISDLGTFLAGLRPEVGTVVLDPAKPALAQIAQELAQDRQSGGGLDAIHVIAHGKPGEVSFASGAFSLTTMNGQTNELAAIGGLLGDGEIRLWTCETAKGAEGAAFVAALARATGARVAASTRVIGASSKGGSWQLDARAWSINTPGPLTADGVKNYEGVMVAKSWANVGTSGNWNSSGNWTPVGVPASGDTVTIGTSTTTSYVVTVDTAATMTSLTISGDTSGTVHSTTVTVTAGNSITSSGAINLSNTQAFINGAGAINATGGISGTGTISAGTTTTGGTLDVTGTIGSGVVLAIGTAASSTLKIEGTATAANAIAINNANQTLELGTAGHLTISVAQTVTNGTIKLDANTSVLTDTAGLVISSGAKLTGAGTVTAGTGLGTHLSGTGTIVASNGTLDLKGTVDSGLALQIDSASASVLKIDGAATAATAITDATGTANTFNSSNQTLEIGTGSLTINAAQTVTNGTIQLDGASSSLNDGQRKAADHRQRCNVDRRRWHDQCARIGRRDQRRGDAERLRHDQRDFFRDPFRQRHDQGLRRYV